MKEKRNIQRGFTLVELLVVMAILGLLATIGLGSFMSTQIKGRDSQRKSDLGQIQKALEMYYNDYGQYPDSLPAGGSSWEDTKGTLYMKAIPADPKFGNYAYSSNGSSYRLYARLENTQDSCFTNGLCKDYGLLCGTANCNYAMSSQNIMP
ncbi:MAG: prepilin-type N-terminal cleavage/methylation domain-containing protein [Candidatus Shapirobacteria bacterium]|nr:prepilin-type N-terminal cleavage/methylation domain-containing protein [Candidatus Shapirobacteria bacterium]